GDDNGDDGIDDSSDDSGDSDDDSTGDDDGGGATSGGGPTSGGGASSGGGGTGFGGGGGAAAADPSAEEPAVEDPLTGPVTSGGALPAPSAGSAEVIVDGTTSLATTSASLDTLAVNGGGVSADLAATDSRGTPSPVRGGVMNLPPGGRITVAGTGLDPGASAVVWLLSDPVRLGTATVAGDGALRTTFTVPRTVPTGPHTLQLVLPTTDGAPVALSLGVAVGPVTSRFPDVAVGGTHWLAIEQLVAWEVTRGSRTGTYDPWRPVTRGQMATFLTRLLDLAPTGRSSFPDTAASTHERGILAVADAGIAGGFTDGTFRPEATLTRGQLATFLLRAAELEPRASGTATDVAGTTHERAIHAVMAAGIAGGFPDGTYRPNDPVARAQMATLLVGLESQISR
ncbi:MAG: S-layer homology domain-containing protein, partial [Nitriliruptoraceae bacterium]